MAAGKTLGTLALIGGAIAIYLITKATNFINGLKFAFTNISLSGTLDMPTVTVTLTINNPSNTTITIDSIRGSLYYQGRKLADVETVSGVTVIAMSNVYLDLKIFHFD